MQMNTHFDRKRHVTNKIVQQRVTRSEQVQEISSLWAVSPAIFSFSRSTVVICSK